MARIDKRGFIPWNRRSVFISSALVHELIELTPNPISDVRGQMCQRCPCLHIARLGGPDITRIPGPERPVAVRETRREPRFTGR